MAKSVKRGKAPKSRARWILAGGGRVLRRIGWRRGLAGFLLAAVFALGFYLANLYASISVLIEQRRAALTSAIYSAPLVIHPGDQLESLHLQDRLARLSYLQTANPIHPGEFAVAPNGMTLYGRDFSIGTRGFPAALVRIRFDQGQVSGIADSFGVALPQATIEPEVIGRLLPDAPAERVEVPLEEMPPYLVKGLLATEDRYFYYHFGFDPIRMIEAALIDYHSHRLRQGASTLTQQLARTFIDNRERTFRRKFRELAIALVLEMRLSKHDILERYVNDVAMGEYGGTPVYGLPLAARYYFNKDIRQVSPAEAATLVGMIQAPTLYDPRRHPEAARTRRDTVLALMQHAHVIDDAQYASARATPVQTVKGPGLRRAPYFTDYVMAQVAHMPGVNGHLGGLRVYSTLDPDMQETAQDAVVANLERLEKAHPRLRRRLPANRLESTLVALDPVTGAIVAMVGGRDYATSQFNRAASAQRQPGSAFKPIVYVTALDPALSPLSYPVTLASILPDRPMSFGGWTPANYERTYREKVTVTEALAESLNVPTAYLGSLLGPPAMISTAHLLGIRGDLPDYLPISIGAGEVTLLDLASAYAVFADGGVAETPYAIDAVVDGNSRVIYQHLRRPTRVMSRAIAYLMTGALQTVFAFGTGEGASKMGLDFPAAGKTGTTEDYHDAYFMGYTRQLVAGVWVGFDDPQSIGLPGADAALPAWVDFMTDAVRQPQVGFGAPPPGITMATVDPASGGIATPACPRKVALPFLSGTEPTQLCPLHSGVLKTSVTTPPVPVGFPTNPSGVATDTATAEPEASPSPATNNVLGPIGNFLSGLFGHH